MPLNANGDAHAAKTQISRLLDQAAAGEEIVIARAGNPVARLVALASSNYLEPGTHAKRVLGLLAGELTVPETFDHPLPDAVLNMFEGR